MKRWMLGLGLVVLLGGNSIQAYAMEEDQEEALTESVSEEDTIEEYLEQLDFDEVDSMLAEEGTGITFEGLVQSIINGEEIDKGELLKKFLTVIFEEVLAFRYDLLQMILLCVVFSILYNFTNIFENPAVTEISFYMVYMLLLVLLLKSFFVLKDVVLVVLEDMLVFLKLLVPTFSLSMVFSGQMTIGTAFYEIHMKFKVVFSNSVKKAI